MRFAKQRPPVLTILVFFAFAPLGYTHALASDDPLTNMLECRGIADKEARLNCFDAAVAGIPDGIRRSGVDTDIVSNSRTLDGEEKGVTLSEGYSEAEPEDEVQAQNAATEFGADDLRKTKPRKKLNEAQRVLVAGLVEVGKNRRGKYLVLLDNGQVWRQLKADSNSLLVPKDLEGATAKIRRKSMGSHMLTLSTGRRSIRVERIK